MQRAEEEAQKAEAERIAREEAEAKRKAQEEEAAREAAEAKKKAEETEIKIPELPAYPYFDYSRLVEMGLSDEEAKDFVKELIPQIEELLPSIEKAIEEKDFQQMERLTHGIKGSSANIDTGGIANLLVDYNTYLKTGDDAVLSKAYFEELKIQLDKLKAQFRRVSAQTLPPARSASPLK